VRPLLSLCLALAPALATAPTLATAQDRVKPEVMLLIDSSSSMQWTQDGVFPACAPPDSLAPARNADYGRSRMTVAKDVLTGAPRNFRQGNVGGPFCIEHTPEFRAGQVPRFLDHGHSLGPDGNFSHSRSMCCAALRGPNCESWAPCGGDHAIDAKPSDATPLPFEQVFEPDGVVFNELDTIKFGLMTLDAMPQASGAPGDHYSFGEERLDVPPLVAARVGTGTPVGFSGALARGITRPNLGARDVDAPFGGLVRGSRGAIDAVGEADPDAVIDETPESIRAHNRYVMDRIRAVVPFGFTPLGPLLHDLTTYYDQEDDADPAAQCRPRVAVLITDGAPTEYYGGQRCDADEDCGGVEGALCDLVEGLKVCRYPDGYPYQAPAEYAAALHGRGVPLYVVGFRAGIDAVERAQEIAAAGAPELGDEGADGFFFADDDEGLSAALQRVTTHALRGLRTRSRPLVIAPSRGDDLNGRDVRQWRLVAFSEVPGGGDEGRYGQLTNFEMGCEPFASDEDGEPSGALELLRILNFHDIFSAGDERQPVGNGEGRRGRGPVNALERLEELREGGPGAAVAHAIDVLRGIIGRRGRAAVDPVRSLGAFEEGDLIALQSPRDGLQGASYEAFLEAHADRPTTLVIGGADGQIHFFRAQDGKEIITYIPKLVWQRATEDGQVLSASGPLAAKDLAVCRALDSEGRDDCPASPSEVQFRTALVGGVGASGSNIFGLDMTHITTLADPDNDGAPLDVDAAFPARDGGRSLWDLTNEEVADADVTEPDLGTSVSRPFLTHLRIRSGDRDEVRAVAIVGCGDDVEPSGAVQQNEARPGRCVLVLDAFSGEILRRFGPGEGVTGRTPMDAPMVGSPVAWPSGGIAASERGYIGDRVGRLWRMDFRDPDPADWTITAAWPPEDDDDALGYVTGRPVVQRPGLAAGEDGALTLVFGTGESGQPEAHTSHLVSLTDRPVVENEKLSYALTGNWVMPLGVGEFVTGQPVIRSEVAYFTTAAPRDHLCVDRQGRIYGLDYRKVLPADEDFETEDGRTLNVIGRIPRLDGEGQRIADAVSVLLPPGRIAFGLTVVLSPSCLEGGQPSTELVLNLADETAGARGAIRTNEMGVEAVANARLRPAALDGSVYVKGSNQTLSLCLDCDRTGKSTGHRARQLGPFPGVVVSWGSTFVR
jgi:hypothetical protein